MKPIIHDLQVEYRSIASLRPAVRNPRTHSPKQIQQLVDSVRTFGFTNPILVDTEGRVLAGHGRLAAAKILQLERVPTIQLDQLTPAQRRAYVLADNRLAERAGWDQELLAMELADLRGLELDFDLTVTGFDMEDIDFMIDQAGPMTPHPAEDVIPEPDPSLPVVTQLGDLWELGPHRLLCGDATHAKSFVTLMEAEHAQMVFVDPPYNVPIPGHVSGLGSQQHINFPMAVGELSEAEFTQFLKTICTYLAAYSQDGAIQFVCMDWRHVYECLTAVQAVYTDIKNLCVWKKTNGGMGTFYRSQHELIVVAKHGQAPHINNFELGQHGRYRTNVWEYPGNNAFHEKRLDELAMHPTVKPVALVADAIKDCSHRGGLILDCCAGSGTTVIAAEQTGRRTYSMEVVPRYVDVAIARWQQVTGQEARHHETGQTWAQMQHQRMVEGRDQKDLSSSSPKGVGHG